MTGRLAFLLDQIPRGDAALVAIVAIVIIVLCWAILDGFRGDYDRRDDG